MSRAEETMARAERQVLSGNGSVQPLPQHLEHLKLANYVRFTKAEVKRELAAGKLTVGQALADERSAKLTIEEVLMSQPRWGKARARRVLVSQEMLPSRDRRVEELTDRQKETIAEACKKKKRKDS